MTVLAFVVEFVLVLIGISSTSLSFVFCVHVYVFGAAVVSYKSSIDEKLVELELLDVFVRFLSRVDIIALYAVLLLVNTLSLLSSLFVVVGDFGAVFLTVCMLSRGEEQPLS